MEFPSAQFFVFFYVFFMFFYVFYVFLCFLCFFMFFFIFFYFLFFFVNLYPTAAIKCCIPQLPPNIVSRYAATKCRNRDKKNDIRRWGGDKKNEFRWFYTPLESYPFLLLPRWKPKRPFFTLMAYSNIEIGKANPLKKTLAS